MDTSRLPPGYTRDVIHPPFPFLWILFTIPKLFLYSVKNLFFVSLRQLFTRPDLPFRTDLFRALLRMSMHNTPLSVKRYSTSSPLRTTKILSHRRFQSYRGKMCHDIQTNDFIGHWISRNLYAEMRTPSSPSTPLRKKKLLWIHGGGYWNGNPLSNIEMQIRIAEILAEHGVELDVFSLRYGLAPEAAFPVQERHAVAAYRYLVQVEGVESKDIIVHGESAGGHLALLLLVALTRPENRELGRPGGALLMYPWTNMFNAGASMHRNRNNCLLTHAGMEKMADWAVGGAEGRRRWAGVMDFTRPRGEEDVEWKDILPERTWVNVGAHDLLVDDVQAWVRRAEADGAVVFKEVTKGQLHGWQRVEDLRIQSKYCALGSDDVVPEDYMVGSRNVAMGLLRVLGGK